MYKIDVKDCIYSITCANDSKTKTGNKTGSKQTCQPDISVNPINFSKLLSEDTYKMHLLPPHCEMTPTTYKDFFNSNSVLPGVEPYKINKDAGPKNGKYNSTSAVESIEYRNFYSDWKQDVLKWKLPAAEPITYPYSKAIVYNANDEHIKMYEETKRHNQFAKPMANIGSNKLIDVFGEETTKTTFNFTRYGNRGPKDEYWVNNPIYSEDITEESRDLKIKYINDIPNRTMELYSSVFEDMYILGYNPNKQDTIDKNINNLSIINMRRS